MSPTIYRRKSNLTSRSAEGNAVVHEGGLFTRNRVIKLRDYEIRVTSDFNWGDQCVAAAKEAGESFLL